MNNKIMQNSLKEEKCQNQTQIKTIKKWKTMKKIMSMMRISEKRARSNNNQINQTPRKKK